jgi:hypothetical protein
MGYYDDMMDLMDAAWTNPELAGIAEAAGAYDMMEQQYGMDRSMLPPIYRSEDDDYDDEANDPPQLEPMAQRSGKRTAEADMLARELGVPVADHAAATAHSDTTEQVRTDLLHALAIVSTCLCWPVDPLAQVYVPCLWTVCDCPEMLIVCTQTCNVDHAAMLFRSSAC